MFKDATEDNEKVSASSSSHVSFEGFSINCKMFLMNVCKPPLSRANLEQILLKNTTRNFCDLERVPY